MITKEEAGKLRDEYDKSVYKQYAEQIDESIVAWTKGEVTTFHAQFSETGPLRRYLTSIGFLLHTTTHFMDDEAVCHISLLGDDHIDSPGAAI